MSPAINESEESKQTRGFSSQFFVAGELSRRGLVAVITNGNCPNTDILCSDVEGTGFVHVQVKTFVPGTGTCSVGKKAEKEYGENFFWVLGGIPKVGSDKGFVYYVIPSVDLARNVREAHQQWLDAPGKKGQPHNDSTMRTVALPPKVNPNGWDLAAYEDRWDLITARLDAMSSLLAAASP